MAKISHKLKNSLQGALAGGGDPATSPLYVFGPFLALVITSGAAKQVFGGAVWLAVFTIAIVSAMYRLVMRWITDGSGGSGLNEEEFGGWAVKINAAVTFIEYTLTFLVSMAAMVTFIADRIPALNQTLLGIEYRTFIALALSILTGWLVNRGPKMVTRTFGPATAGVLILLWVMILATLFRNGFHLPEFSISAFSSSNIKFTLGGYVRILAVMTGIEVFANLVPAFAGTSEQKSRKAFQSLLIIMVTTAITMLVVGPAIFSIADPANNEVSVFTQTMDAILPAPLPWIGSLVGVFVLMSASAASAQGLQNLALGLKERHYVPPVFGLQNQYEVADKPVWLEVGVVCFCFLLFGTDEATYLSLYAAGVFILLSMTGWSVTKRLGAELKTRISLPRVMMLIGAMIAAGLTTIATIIIFEERFLEGAWSYLIFIPILYVLFTYVRKRIGAPTPEMDYLGQIDSNLLAGFGFGQSVGLSNELENGEQDVIKPVWKPEPVTNKQTIRKEILMHHLLTILDGSEYAAQAIPITNFLSEAFTSQVTLLSASRDFENDPEKRAAIKKYLCEAAETIHAAGVQVSCLVQNGTPAQITEKVVKEKKVDMVVITTRGSSGEKNWLSEGLSSKLVHRLDIPVLLVQVYDSGPAEAPHIGRILVTLDGSAFSEQILPYVRLFGHAFNCEIMLICVPAVPESQKYRAPASVVNAIRKEVVAGMKKYLHEVAETMRKEGLTVNVVVTGSYPARTIVDVGKREGVDLIMLTSQGRGGLDLIFMGSVAQQVVQLTDSPVFILPINREL